MPIFQRRATLPDCAAPAPRACFLAALLLGSAVLPALAAAPQPAAVLPHAAEDFLRKEKFKEIKISPDGTYFAATVAHEDKTILVFMRRSDLAVTGAFNMAGKTHVHDFWWVNDERVLLTTAEKFGSLDQPLLTGEIFGSNADGKRQDALIGFRAGGKGVGTRIKPREPERVSADIIDTIPGDPDSVLVAVWPWTDEGDPYTRVERMDVYSGRRTTVARAPIRRASFVTDPSGEVRFATGQLTDNQAKTYYRAGADAEWELINDASKTGRGVYPLGFNAEGSIAYLMAEQERGPNLIEAFDTRTRERTVALRSEYGDPWDLLRNPHTRAVIGALYMEGKPAARFFDPDEAASRRYRSLQASFPDQLLTIDSTTRDGNLALLYARSDRNPGDYFLFDATAKSAAHVISARDWIDPARTAEVRPVALEARDGLPLHGYLTLPPGRAAKNLPLVVNPHGGPFDVADMWGFDSETQLLAARGYAVLQVNFRGSDLYGRAFAVAGYRQWGRAMQDDLTDATRWAVAQGIADPQRICIYGASYGGYAALMGAAKEPALYRCAVGYIGVYDLEMMHKRGDVQQVRWGEHYLDDALGTEGLPATSPVRLAAQIQVPVFLAAGGLDARAPLAHTTAMERALQQAGKQVETLVYPTEGHGFYDEAHKREFYQRLLAFLDRHIGKAAAPHAAAPVTTSTPAPE